MIASPSFATIPHSLRLSQGHLALLATCPRKFQQVVLEQLSTPDDPDHQERLNQGSRFHLLLQQWLLGLPITPFVQEDETLRAWFEAFQAASPTILNTADSIAQRETESDRTLEFQGYLLTVRYDLLLMGNHYARILDWKTYPRPKNSKWLEQHWQTRLYPFVLAEASDYRPDDISMIYWFFQTGSKESNTPQNWTVRYNSAKHEQTRQELSHLLNQLTHYLERYQAGEDFPQVPVGAESCDGCNLSVRCDRVPVAQDPASLNAQVTPYQDIASEVEASLSESLLALENIEEVPL